MTDLKPLLIKAKALVDAVSHDDNGSMVAGQFVGGNGGLLSRESMRCADELRKELTAWKGLDRVHTLDEVTTAMGHALKDLDRPFDHLRLFVDATVDRLKGIAPAASPND